MEKLLILRECGTHYSPSMNKPDEYIDKLKKICPVIETARDGWSVELGYEEE